VPQQRRQVGERHRHPDVVHRAVGDRPDGEVTERAAAEQPHVAGRGGRDGFVEVEHGGGHGP
jgi:hypothetical protein